MSLDSLRYLKSIGRDLSQHNSFELDQKKLSDRVCLAIATPRKLADNSAYLDAYKAAKMFIRADFTFYYLPAPTYPVFCEWVTYFLENVTDYLSIVITGFPLVPCDGSAEEGHPFMIKDREILPKRLFSLISKHKNEKSRLTVLINGSPAVESWSNSDATQTLNFSTTCITATQEFVRPFNKEVAPATVLVTSCIRPDYKGESLRTKANYSPLIAEVSKEAKADPVASIEELLERLYKKLRGYGEEMIVYASNDGIASRTFLL